MKGYLGEYQDGRHVYLTPDGKHAISGYMYNEKVKILRPDRKKGSMRRPDEVMAKMETSWILDGKKTRRWCCMSSPTLSAPIVAVLAASSPVGRIRQGITITYVTGRVIKPENPAAAAAILAAKDPAKHGMTTKPPREKMASKVPASIPRRR